MEAALPSALSLDGAASFNISIAAKVLAVRSAEHDVFDSSRLLSISSVSSISSKGGSISCERSCRYPCQGIAGVIDLIERKAMTREKEKGEKQQYSRKSECTLI